MDGLAVRRVEGVTFMYSTMVQMTTPPLRALVVDDHPLMSSAISTALRATRRFQEIEVAASLREALEILVGNSHCNLVMLDMHLILFITMFTV